MKANEFRIGNILTVKGKEDILTGIAENDYVSKLHGHGIDNDDIEVITLTDDWLEKFDISDDYFYYINNGGLLEFGVEVLPDNYYNTVLAQLKYVHQLQNLYFALTGEELKTK
jgi:histidyl-tRNA synthetase